jgi:MarR family transcriptional regulator, negative regulator of the multidrug operon emrRAB
MTRRTNGPLDESVVHLLQNILLSAEDLFRTEMTDSAIVTPRELAVLISVAQSEGIIQMRIAEQTGIHKTTLVYVLKRLEQKGLVRRGAKGGRAKGVQLTAEGRRALTAGLPLAKRIERRILSSVPNNERNRFIEHLQSIVDSLQELP